MIKMQTFLCDSDQQVGGYGNPYLRLHGVPAGAKEHLDAQVLFDPLEEQFHLPTLAVQIGDQFGLQGKVVGQKHQPFYGIVLDHHPAQHREVTVTVLSLILKTVTMALASSRCYGQQFNVSRGVGGMIKT